MNLREQPCFPSEKFHTDKLHSPNTEARNLVEKKAEVWSIIN